MEDRLARLKPGDRAPDFALSDQRDKTVKLKDFRGQRLVVYFYPKADTPGCTAQSCALRDTHPGLKKLKAAVVGISPDVPAKQRKFDTSTDSASRSSPTKATGSRAPGACGANKTMYGKKFKRVGLAGTNLGSFRYEIVRGVVQW